MNHSTSQRDMHSSSFSMPGISSSTSGSSPNLWSHSTSSNSYPSLSDSLSQPRPQYQAGYLMSASTSNVYGTATFTSSAQSLTHARLQNTPQSGQRYDDAPIIPTKAKMNHALARSTTSDFGTDSMFEKSRTSRPDEDAPPLTSVNELMNDIQSESSQSRFRPGNSFRSPLHHTLVSSRPPPSALPPQSAKPQGQDSQPLYVIVFGYPPDKYTATIEYFRSLAGESETTEATPHSQISNCFKLGFKNPGDALRAVRKNGEVIEGAWMIGTQWADPQLVESTLGPLLTRGGIFDTQSPTPNELQADTAMAVDDGFPASINSPSSGSFSNGPNFGTPIRLAPPGAAFRRAGVSTARNTPTDPTKTPPQGLPELPRKGMLGQVSEILFGW